MPVLPNQIKIAELDYDQILTNLVEFMKQDPAFSDYDFAGSGLRLLTRVLAYATFYNNYYLTQAVNEGFLDTAQLRSSVASHAHMLGYMLKGTLSAHTFANVVVELANTSAPQITLPKTSQFSLQANSQFAFYTLDDTILTQNATTLLYEAAAVELVEGQPLTYRFVVDTLNPTQRFIIPNANIDYTTIAVNVQQSQFSNVISQWTNETNYLSLGPDDRVFFVQESYNGFPELKFGNGVVGKAVETGNIIIADYFVSRGSDGNNIRGPFQILTSNVSGFVRGFTTTDANTASSSGGSDQESLDSAKFLAPLVYQAQNRCVTTADYKAIILAQYGENIAAINVFGGEEGDPADPLERPVFGRVFIALKPKIGLRFTDVVRQFITQNIVQPRSIVGVIPEVIDPDYTFLLVSTSVKYDPRDTTRSKLQLQDAIKTNILAFAEKNVEKFDKSFRFSRFVRVIDDTDTAIVSSLTRVDLEKRIFPTLAASNQAVLKYGMPIRKISGHSAVLETNSHRFTYVNDAGVQQDKCFFVEDAGALHVAYRSTTNTLIIFKRNVGTVDVTTGLVTLTNFAPVAIEDDAIDVRIRVIPAINDFTPRLNQLFTIDDADIAVQLLNDSTATIDDQTSFFTGGILP
jgi:hypothetical protein